MACIYLITNTITNEKYIGQTTHSPYVRFAEHIKDCKRFSERKLYSNMAQYGIDNFIIELLENCEPEQLNEREIYWIATLDTYNNGLNDTPGGSMKKLTPEKQQDIIAMYLSNPDYTPIIQKYGINRTTIHDILVAQGVQTIGAENSIKMKYGVKIARIDPNTGEILATYQSQMDAGRWLKEQGLSNITDLRKLSYNLGLASKNHTKLGGYYWQTSAPLKQQTNNLEEKISRAKLKDMIRHMPFTKIALQFGVSDKTISRWCIKYGLPATKAKIALYTDEEWSKL